MIFSIKIVFLPHINFIEMNIKFNEINIEELPNFKGGEKFARMQFHVDENNRIMRGCLVPGASIGLHTHETNSEIMYILQGSGKVLCDGEYSPVTVGDVHYCPKGHEHSLINSGNEDLVFFAVVPEHK